MGTVGFRKIYKIVVEILKLHFYIISEIFFNHRNFTHINFFIFDQNFDQNLDFNRFQNFDF